MRVRAGYACDLSPAPGREVELCLSEAFSPGERLPVESVNGNVVGRAAVGRQARHRPEPLRPWREGFNLAPRARFELDASLASGVYKADGIPFVNRGAAGQDHKVAVLIPSNTATAFNRLGGRSFYDSPPPAQADDVLSFQRPVESFQWMFRGALQCEGFLSWFADANPRPAETAYLIDSDLEDPAALDGIELLIVIGRSEYWTRRAREHFDAFVDRGGRALLLCSELMYWQVRIDLDRHRLIRYLEDDPHPDPLLHTKQWHEPSLRYPVHPGTGCELRYGGYDMEGEQFGQKGLRIASPGSPFLEGSGLAEGDLLQLPDASVWDGAPVKHGDLEEHPELDFGDDQPLHHEVIGYNRGRPALRQFGESATSLWLALRRTQGSGTVVHCGTLGWCGWHGAGGAGPDSERIRTIVLRMISILLEDSWPFSFADPVHAGNRR